jgi:L-cysteine S-thiosulfotransferase
MTRLWIFCLAVFPLAASAQTTIDVQKVLQRDFHPRGQATMERVVQDGLQRVCTESSDRPPAELAKQLEADQMKTIAFP